MNQSAKRILCTLLLIVMVLTISPFQLSVAAADATIGTGYTSAEDVQYVISNGYTANWGYRGETCLFLSPYANDFYTSDYSFETLSQFDGGTSTSDAPQSELYLALQSLMATRHTNQTSYGDTRFQYMYTDCQLSDTTMILSFYSGDLISSTWDSGVTWNREHTWPASKSLSGRPSNSSKGEGADIMMLRPTAKSENGSRSNKAYGLSSGFYDPGVSVRGDCARILLYTYVRWGNTQYMWGSGGVIENLDILLQWMEEDPVDTWEMGRNDAVQSITGTRNIFVDYPEYAWLLFGQEIPEDLVSPTQSKLVTDDGSDNSGTPDNGDNTEPPACTHETTERKDASSATCTKDGYTGNLVCVNCNEVLEKGQSIAATGEHTFGKWRTTAEATVDSEGEEVRICATCFTRETRSIEKLPSNDAVPSNSMLIVMLCIFIPVLAGCVTLFFVIKKKK